MGQTRDFTFFTFLINDETFHQQAMLTGLLGLFPRTRHGSSTARKKGIFGLLSAFHYVIETNKRGSLHSQKLQDAVQVDLDDDSLPSLVSDSDDDIEESKGAAGHEWVEEDDGDGGVEEDDDDGGVEESKDHTPTVVFADPELYAKLLLSETEFWEYFVVGGPSLLSKNVNSVKQVVNGTLTN
jgi:hypothetical protein